jgi:hypothetical protein
MNSSAAAFLLVKASKRLSGKAHSFSTSSATRSRRCPLCLAIIHCKNSSFYIVAVFSRWQREYKSKGLQVIGVTYPPEELAEVRGFIKSIKVNYPVALGDEQKKAMFDKGETFPVTAVMIKRG